MNTSRTKNNAYSIYYECCAVDHNAALRRQQAHGKCSAFIFTPSKIAFYRRTKREKAGKKNNLLLTCLFRIPHESYPISVCC